MWPNFVGSEEAPTTAKYGAVKKARAAASVAILFRLIERFIRMAIGLSKEVEIEGRVVEEDEGGCVLGELDGFCRGDQ